MAKYRRTNVGSIVKGKDGGADYIKISKDIMLKQGDFLNLESKAQQLKSVQEAVSNGKLSGEVAETIMENIEKIPDFVRFSIVRIEKQ